MMSSLSLQPPISPSLLQPCGLSKASIGTSTKANDILPKSKEKNCREKIWRTVSGMKWSYELDAEFVLLINKTSQVSVNHAVTYFWKKLFALKLMAFHRGSIWHRISVNIFREEDRHWIIIALQVRLNSRRFNRLLSSVLPVVDLRPAVAALSKIELNSNRKRTLSNLMALNLGERIASFRSLIFLDVKGPISIVC